MLNVVNHLNPRKNMFKILCKENKKKIMLCIYLKLKRSLCIWEKSTKCELNSLMCKQIPFDSMVVFLGA